MSSWTLSDLDFNVMTDFPTWAVLNLPLNQYAEFILQAPREDDEELIPQDNMYDADDEGVDKDQLHRRICEIKVEERTHLVESIESWNYPSASTHLHQRIQQLKEEERRLNEEERIHLTNFVNIEESAYLHQRIQQIKEEKRQEEEEEESERIRQELYGQAIDSEPPNSLSECSDYPAGSHSQLYEPFPRIEHYEGFHPNTEVEPYSSIRETIFNFTYDREIERLAEAKTPMLDKAPRPRTRIGRHPLRLDRPAPTIDFPKVFPENTQNEVSSPVDIQVENNFAGFETMEFEELVCDYKVAPLLHPTRPSEVYRCDIEQPRFFILVPHWFSDSETRSCYCIYCIQYREILSTGKQLEAHDFNKWCLCPSCMDFWHENFNDAEDCNCQDCDAANKAEALKEKEEEEREALADLDELLRAQLEEAIIKLESLLQSPEQEPMNSEREALTDLDDELLRAGLEEAIIKLQSLLQSPEQEPMDPEQQILGSPQKLPSDPLCEDPATVVPESKEGSFDLFKSIRENLWLDSDSGSGSDADAESQSSFDFDAE